MRLDDLIEREPLADERLEFTTLETEVQRIEPGSLRGRA